MNPTPAPSALRGGRFDSLDGSYAYLYVGEGPDAAIAETLCRDLPFAGSARIVPRRRIEGRMLTQLEVTRGLPVVSLHGPDLTQVGQDLWLTKSEPVDYDMTRAWAAAIRGWVPEAGGFVYRCRHDEDLQAWVLFTAPGVAVHPALAEVPEGSLPLDNGAGLVEVRRVLARHHATLARG
ncbi:MAG: RES family NAD+ phosphorylase [Actinomycetota bacterium]|nr:RES family NAD+ phosphorylase [Actinomycetota bacterium]